jgi:hypothetical protein
MKKIMQFEIDLNDPDLRTALGIIRLGLRQITSKDFHTDFPALLKEDITFYNWILAHPEGEKMAEEYLNLKQKHPISLTKRQLGLMLGWKIKYATKEPFNFPRGDYGKKT